MLGGVPPRTDTPALYRLLEVVRLRELLRGLYRVEIRGGDRLPQDGSCIVVANHESMADPFILGVATDRPIRFMAKAELWSNPLLEWAMERLGTFPVDRGTGDTAALGRGAQLLAEGALLGIFPQGTSMAYRRRPFHRGAARLALVTGAPLVPVCLIGTERILPTSKRYRFGRPRVAILVADPIPVEPGRPTVAAAKALTQRIEDAIAELRRPFGPPAHAWLD
jgi:1-acyl-sn-glycerol-3-phosphate acyltransferase